MRTKILATATAMLALATMPLLAQEEMPPPVVFGDGELGITQGEDEQKVLRFNGLELLRNFYVAYLETATVGGKPIAFFEAGEGGNTCAPELVAIWENEGDPDPRVDHLGENGCSSGEVSIEADAVRMTPYVVPGETQPVRAWSPERGVFEDGTVSFEPAEGTGWADLEPEAMSHPYDLFANADVYAEAQALLGGGLAAFARGLSVASEPEFVAGRFIVGDGCVPHSCTLSDAFIAVDTKDHKLFVAQKADSKLDMIQPDRSQWPAEMIEKLDEFAKGVE
ncbi:MAG: hypothetical protein ACRECW_11850 [Phyllobacterium sp.]